MNFAISRSDAHLVRFVDYHATLTRLIGNLSGFVYRRRPDARWTMEFVSPGVRDVTGYDPHRFIDNASIAFGDLVAPADRERANERVRLAALHRQRATVEYLIRTAYGAWLQVEDRLTPIVDDAGEIVAIEGLIDRPRWKHTTTGTSLPVSDHARLTVPFAPPPPQADAS